MNDSVVCLNFELINLRTILKMVMIEACIMQHRPPGIFYEPPKMKCAEKAVI